MDEPERTKEDDRPLNIACDQVNLQAIRRAIDSGKCNINNRTRDNLTPVVRVLSAKVYTATVQEAVELLVANGARPNTGRKGGKTPLILCCERPVDEIVYAIAQVLILPPFGGLTADKTDGQGRTALWYVCQRVQLGPRGKLTYRLVKDLLCGCRACPDKPETDPPILAIIRGRNWRLAMHFLRRGAKVDVPAWGGREAGYLLMDCGWESIREYMHEPENGYSDSYVDYWASQPK